MYATMTRSKRLSPVLKIAESKTLYAARAVAESRRQILHYEQKLNELLSFRNEYRQRLRSSHSSTTSAIRLREYQQFLQQMNEGIKVLSEQVEQLKNNGEQTESKWRKAKYRTDALDKLILKLEGMEENLQLNRESNEVDERSQRSKDE